MALLQGQHCFPSRSPQAPVFNKSRASGVFSPAMPFSWQWVGCSVATIYQWRINPSYCSANSCPQRQSQEHSHILGGRKVEQLFSDFYKLAPSPGQALPVSYPPWKLTLSPTRFTGVSRPVSSLKSELLSLISSSSHFFLPFLFLSLSFLFFFPWCSVSALLRCYLQDSLLMLTSASSFQRQLEKLLL